MADREGKGSLDKTEFCIAMHLITCYKSRALAGFPNVLPPALFEAAARRPNTAARSPVAPAGPSAIPRQFTGPQARAQSPLARAAFGAPPAMAPQTTGPAWLITPQEKAKYDQFFSSIDTTNHGHLSGEQAVKFFSDSGLPEDTLASVWDLADINSEGQLNRDEFAVAMYLIRQQRSGAPLPAFLPPALIPPSMRNQSHPTPQTTAPAFDNANNSSQLPKSATEDLFGLDEPMPQMPSQQPTLAPVSTQNTGSVFGADPFAGGSKPSSPPSTSPTRNFTPQQTGGGPASLFKPFIPTSAFGATLASQHTGSSNAPSNAPSNTARSVQPPSAMDDLLGASNEEETRNITEDTTELANMSNQLGNLRNQMQDVQTKKTTNERDLAASSAQKRELEQRLAQFRAQYEQEVRTVKSLEEQLANSRNETKKLQQEFAMIEGTYQDLQNQNQQISQALSADQQENASLKQRISQMNTEIAQLKPQLDKMRSDARQQKGMVAINKKQLATNEGEHEKIQTEMGDLKKAAEEHEQQMREQAAQEERSRQAQEERSRSVVSPPSTVVSPAPSNTNPFFRKATATREEGTLSPPGGAFSSGAPNHSAFDALFGPSASQQAGPHTPPVTSFKSEPSGNSASSDGRMTPASPTLSAATHDEAPPPPPESRQFTPNILPMRQPLTRDQSVASSNRAAPPGSRLGEQDAASVSSPWDAAPTSSYSTNPWGGEDVATPPAQMSGPAIQSQNHDSNHDAASRDLSPEKLEEEIPGAFPETPMETQTTGQSAQASTHDFDSAFAGFGEGQQQSGSHAASHDPFAPASVSREVEHAPSSHGNQAAAHDPFAPAPVSREIEHAAPTYDNHNVPHDSFASAPVSRAVEPALPNYGNSEFPPIQTLEHEDTSSDDDSDSERGFGDDFGSSEPHATAAATELPSSQHHEITPVDTRRPSAVGAQSAADLSELPPITAQTSPPSYEAAQEGQHRSGSNNFPPEFAGLLPAREDPTQSPVPHSIPHEQQPQTPLTSTAGSDHFHDAHSRPMSSITDAGTTPFTNLGDVTQHVTPVAPQETTKDAFDDDFDDFDDLAEAKEASGENFDFGFPHHQNTDEFDSNFDSPAQSTMQTTSSAQETPVTRTTPGGFSNFESNTGAAHQPIPIAIPFGSTHEPQAQQPHDWDAIFSGLDTPAPVVEPTPNFSSNSRTTDGAATPKASSSGHLNSMPVLGRAISMGTEHDDPILKRLTGMGYQREKALDALEKYDYDIDRVSVC